MFYIFPESLWRFGFSFELGYNCSTYYYKKNAQNDIIAILDIYGNVVVEYKYDAWGNHKVLDVNGNEIISTSHIGHFNPFRYRSYFYDVETGLYYLKSRYYDPKLGRFISPDDISYLDPNTVNGLNLYAYCNNNPVMYADPSGNLPKWLAWTISGAAIVGGIILCATGVGGILGGVLIGAGAGSLINGYVTEAKGGDFAAGYIGGAISGALCGVGAGLGGIAFSAASNVANLATLGYLTLGSTISFAGGFAGNLIGTVYTDWHNSGFKEIKTNLKETLTISLIMGSLNIFAGIGSTISSEIANMAKATNLIDSRIAIRILSGTIAGGTELIYDLISYLISQKLSRL